MPVGVSDPSYLKLAYSFKDYDLSLRASWKYIRDATAEQIENRITRALEADNTLVNGLILQRLFSNIDQRLRLAGTGAMERRRTGAPEPHGSFIRRRP